MQRDKERSEKALELVRECGILRKEASLMCVTGVWCESVQEAKRRSEQVVA